MDHRDTLVALACASGDGRQRTCLPRPIQVLSHPDRRPFRDGGALCGTQRVAGQAGAACRSVALVEPVAARAGEPQADDVVICVARGPATKLGNSCQSTGDVGRPGGATDQCAARAALWGCAVANSYGVTLGTGIHPPLPGASEGRLAKTPDPLSADSSTG